MHLSRFVVFSVIFVLIVKSVGSQQPSTQLNQVPQRDPQAVLLLTQALNAAGGTSAVSMIQDFTGTGTITYFWAGQEVSGPVTVRGLGTSWFRLDAQLPDGTRSWIVNDIQGTTKNADGTTNPIQYSNAVNLGSLTFPYARMAVALSNPSFSISMAGTASVNTRQGTVILIQQKFSASEDPTGDETRLNTKGYVIDSQTFALLETVDTMWSEDGRMLPISHEVVFSNITTLNGLKVPFSIVEQLGGQRTWSLQLDSLKFNTGLTASVFQF